MADLVPLPFGRRRIGPGLPVVVIAEIGINHEGNVGWCARMIEEAAEAGADSIKLQTIDADQNYVRGTESYRLFSKSVLNREETAAMFELARRKGMEPFTTAGDFATLDWVDRLDPAAHKVSSGLLTNLPVLRHIAAKGRTALLSTGMATPADIDQAVGAMRTVPFGLLQCTSLYPAGHDELSLATIGWLRDRYGAVVGFSDHSLGTEAAAVSVGAGAHMIEKHFSFDRTRVGYDHGISLDREGLSELVSNVRAATRMMGRPTKTPTPQERENAKRLHRILVAARSIAAGEVFSVRNVSMKRPLPGTKGLAPLYYERLLGLRAARDLAIDEAITPEAVVDLS